jgi:hypothetical protein
MTMYDAAHFGIACMSTKYASELYIYIYIYIYIYMYTYLVVDVWSQYRHPKAYDDDTEFIALYDAGRRVEQTMYVT